MFLGFKVKIVEFRNLRFYKSTIGVLFRFRNGACVVFAAGVVGIWYSCSVRLRVRFERRVSVLEVGGSRVDFVVVFWGVVIYLGI